MATRREGGEGDRGETEAREEGCGEEEGGG